jgi:DNA-binding NarL/FixJ family response regulator
MKVMIVDDHSLIRTGLRLLLKGEADLSVTAEAATAEEALEKLADAPVDIMILDISMPGMGGLACITEAKRLCPQLRIIMLSMHEDENYIRKAMRLGASGYIPKCSADDELLDALRTVAAGRFYLSPNAEQSLLSSLFAGGSEEEEHPIERLSPRELEVFEYLVHGYTIKEIGAKLQLSVKTIDTHKSKIMEKLDCKKRSELVSLALRYHVLKDENAVSK